MSIILFLLFLNIDLHN